VSLFLVTTDGTAVFPASRIFLASRQIEDSITGLGSGVVVAWQTQVDTRMQAIR
jgi:hypothetical protein